MQQSDYMPALSDKDMALEDEETISISNILHILWLRRRIFLAVVIFVAITATIYISQLIPRYTAEAVILVGIQ